MKNGDNRRILVIRLSALGDVAMTVPVLLALTRTYPGLQLLFLTKDHLRCIPGRVPNTRPYGFDADGAHKGLRGLWRLSRELKGGSLDAVADLHTVLRTRILKFFLSGTGIPFARQDKGRAEKRRLTSWKNKEFRPLRRTVDRYAGVFGELGLPVELLPEDVLPGEPWPGSLAGSRQAGDTHRIGIAPFAAHRGKCYPPEAMEAVVSQLGAHQGVRVYLFGGGREEKAVLDEWENKYPHCTSVAGKIPLTEELALISNLNLMVSMDSGNGHLAAMYGIPVITIWGVTHPFAGFAPYRQPGSHAILADRAQFPLIPTSVYGNKVPDGYEDAIRSIPAESIYRRIAEVLALGARVRQDSGTSA